MLDAFPYPIRNKALVLELPLARSPIEMTALGFVDSRFGRGDSGFSRARVSNCRMRSLVYTHFFADLFERHGSKR